jgi:hypothetical protein
MKLFMRFTTLLDQPKEHPEQYYQDYYAKNGRHEPPYHVESRAEKERNKHYACLLPVLLHQELRGMIL